MWRSKRVAGIDDMEHGRRWVDVLGAGSRRVLDRAFGLTGASANCPGMSRRNGVSSGARVAPPRRGPLVFHLAARVSRPHHPGLRSTRIGPRTGTRRPRTPPSSSSENQSTGSWVRSLGANNIRSCRQIVVPDIVDTQDDLPASAPVGPLIALLANEGGAHGVGNTCRAAGTG